MRTIQTRQTMKGCILSNLLVTKVKLIVSYMRLMVYCFTQSMYAKTHAVCEKLDVELDLRGSWKTFYINLCHYSYISITTLHSTT
jgi:hypothetical protein